MRQCLNSSVTVRGHCSDSARTVLDIEDTVHAECRDCAGTVQVTVQGELGDSLWIAPG